jgi:hypothetical protein
MNNTANPRPVHYIATHPSMHLDEILTIWLARNMPVANRVFPGISTAKVVFWGLGSQTPDGKPAVVWEAKGYYMIGVGGGDGNEHATKKRGRQKGESATSLFIRKIGLENSPWLALAEQFITNEDLHGGSGGLSIPSLVKEMNWQFPDNWEHVMDWAMTGICPMMKAKLKNVDFSPKNPAYRIAKHKVRQALLDAAEVLGCQKADWCRPSIDKLMTNLGPLSLPSITMLFEACYPEDTGVVQHWLAQGAIAAMTSQQKFFGPTKEEYRVKARVEKIDAGRERKFVLAVIESDNTQIGKYALSRHGGGADIVIIQNRRGNVAILTRKSLGMDLRDIIRVIRIRERWLNGHNDEMRWLELETTESPVRGAPNWIIHQEGRMVMNGSISAPDIEPTKLTLMEIIMIVKECLNPQVFEPSRAESCRAGRCCPNGNGSLCRWYASGLIRCRRNRQPPRDDGQGSLSPRA